MCKEFIEFENDDLIEIQFRNNIPYVVGEFMFVEENFIVTHPTSFRLWRPLKFGVPIFNDLPANTNSEEIYEKIGERLKEDFIKFFRRTNNNNK